MGISNRPVKATNKETEMSASALAAPVEDVTEVSTENLVTVPDEVETEEQKRTRSSNYKVVRTLKLRYHNDVKDEHRIDPLPAILKHFSNLRNEDDEPIYVATPVTNESDGSVTITVETPEANAKRMGQSADTTRIPRQYRAIFANTSLLTKVEEWTKEGMSPEDISDRLANLVSNL